MKKYIAFIILILFASPVFAQRGAREAESLYAITRARIKDCSYCQVNAHVKKYFDWEPEPTYMYQETIVSINNDLLKKTTVFYLEHQKILRDAKRMLVIDEDLKAFFEFSHSRKEESEFVSWEDELRSNTIYMTSCFAPWMKSIRGDMLNTPKLLSVSDTVMLNGHYKVIYGRSTFPNCYRLLYYVNPETELIEQLEMILTDSSKASYRASKIVINYDISKQDHSAVVYNQFSTQNVAYHDYEFGHNTALDRCKLQLHVGDTLSDSVLDFPLLNMEGAKTSLRKQGGYVLLDFFHNHCSPCIKFMQEQRNERDSLGATRLEQNGIRLISINTMSRNIEYTKCKLGDALDETNTFLAFGIQEYINISGYPTFILLSPSKKVLYITNRSEPQYIENIIKKKNGNET